MKRDIKKTKLNRELVRPLLLTRDQAGAVVGGTHPISKGADGDDSPTCRQP